MKVLSEEELIEVLKNQSKRSKMISLKTRTDPKPLKKSRVTLQSLKERFNTETIVKESELTVQINIDYETSVNNRLEKAGEEREFVSSGMNYGNFVDGSRCLIEDKGKVYLRTYQTNSKLGKSSRYFKDDGTEFTEDEVEELQKEFLKIKPEEIQSQGLSYEQSTKPTNYSLKSIREICMDGERYILGKE